MERHTWVFGTTVVIQEIRLNSDAEYQSLYSHRLVIGTIASEWASFYFPAHLTLVDRTFVSIIDGRSIFPRCFEVVAGLEKM